MRIARRKPERKDRKSKPVNPEWRNRLLQLGLSILLLVILAFIAWRCMNRYSGWRPGYDSSFFAGAAVHLMKGRVLYRDVWDHKPPMIHLINVCALKFGDGTINSIRTVERIFAVVGAALLFWMVSAAFSNRFLAFFTSLFFVFHMYHPFIYSKGNLTEEYGSIFLIGGICAAFVSRRYSNKVGALFSFVSGLVLSLAVLTKEPFVLSALPWFVYVAWPRKGDWKGALANAGLFVGGALVPVLIFVFYLIINGAVSDFIKVIYYNFAYAGGDGRTNSLDLLNSAKVVYKRIPATMLVTQVAVCLGLVSLFSRSFVKKFHYLPVVIFASLVFSFIAVSIGRHYPHYDMQLAPIYVLAAACGLAFVGQLLCRVKIRWIKILLVILLLTPAVLIDSIHFKYLVHSVKSPSKRWEGDSIAQTVKRHTKKTDTIWVPSPPYMCWYLDADRLSPTKWLFIGDHLFIDTPDSTGQEKLALLKNQLQSNPPRIVAITEQSQPFFDRYGLTEWVKANYKLSLDYKSKTLAEMNVKIWMYAK